MAVTVETADQVREVPVVKRAAGGETSVSLTIQTSWKATGYVVKYGESADNLDCTVTIRRAAVEQLTVDGLDTGKTYWFSVAALNGEVISEYSAPVSAVTAEPGSQNVAVAAVETGSLTLSPFQPQGTVSITASSTFDTEKTLTVMAEDLPEGITVPEGQTFAVPADGSASFALPVTLTGDVEKGWYSVTISVLDGETVLASREVELTVCEGTLLLEDDFSQVVEGRYTQSGSGGTVEVTGGVLKVTNTKGNEAPLITAGEESWSSYTLSSTMQMVNKDALDSGVSAGIIFRYQDDKNFCHARLDLGKGASNPSFQVYRWEDGRASNLFSQQVSGKWDDVYELRVEDMGGMVYFYLDGVPPAYVPEIRVKGVGDVDVTPRMAREGQTVTIRAVPGDGYKLDSLTVTDRNGTSVAVTVQADGTWRFVQPSGKAVITAVFAAAGAGSSTGFADVEAGSWYEAAVSAMVEAGLMQGTGGNLFQPFGTVTRATMWTILARMDGVDTEGGKSWYEKAQTWAMAEGVSDGTNPDAVVTREQIAAMLYRYAGSPAAEGQLDFADSAAVSEWASQAMVWAVKEGILTGTPDGNLNPQGTATRAEAAVMLQRFADAK